MSRAWLAPLGGLFGSVAAARVALYRHGLLPRRRLSGPVISVGNLGVGGSGKTPVVAHVAASLREAGFPVAVLSRGYRGTFRGEALIVSDGDSVRATAREAGDEPVMLARALPGVVVAVGPRRDVVGAAVEARFGRRVHVLDDGFQHLRLHRDLDVLCVDPADLRDRPLPVGRLRERPAAVDRADLVLLWVEGPLDAAPSAGLDPARTFVARRRAQGFFAVDGSPRPVPTRPYVLSGIARPARLAADVAAVAGDIAGHSAFPDHHAFTVAELEAAAENARRSGAGALVTTAKDAVRLPEAVLDPPLLVFRIAVEIRNEAAFRERLVAAAGRAA